MHDLRSYESIDFKTKKHIVSSQLNSCDQPHFISFYCITVWPQWHSDVRIRSLQPYKAPTVDVQFAEISTQPYASWNFGIYGGQIDTVTSSLGTGVPSNMYNIKSFALIRLVVVEQ